MNFKNATKLKRNCYIIGCWGAAICVPAAIYYLDPCQLVLMRNLFEPGSALLLSSTIAYALTILNAKTHPDPSANAKQRCSVVQRRFRFGYCCVFIMLLFYAHSFIIAAATGLSYPGLEHVLSAYITMLTTILGPNPSGLLVYAVCGGIGLIVFELFIIIMPLLVQSQDPDPYGNSKLADKPSKGFKNIILYSGLASGFVSALLSTFAMVSWYGMDASLGIWKSLPYGLVTVFSMGIGLTLWYARRLNSLNPNIPYIHAILALAVILSDLLVFAAIVFDIVCMPSGLLLIAHCAVALVVLLFYPAQAQRLSEKLNKMVGRLPA